jgi:hypothetical protein
MRHKSLESHDEREITIHTHELDLSLKGREIDDPAAHECVEDCALTDHDLVIRRIHDELIRLQTLKHDSVAVQRRNALLIIR